MIEEISQNDYGEEASEHFAAIQAQLESEPTLGLLAWNPREVLELERWNEPDRAYVDAPPSGQHGHVKRLLACIILLRNAAHVDVTGDDEEFFVETSAATLLQLTLSAIALGGDMEHQAMRFLLWVHRMQKHPSLRPFAAFCIMLLCINRTLTGLSDIDLSSVCTWVTAEEAQCREELGDRVESSRWLLGLNSYEDSAKRRGIWIPVKDIVERRNNSYGTETEKSLRDMSDRIATWGGSASV